MKRSKLSLLTIFAVLAALLVGPASQRSENAVADSSATVSSNAHAETSADVAVVAEKTGTNSNGERKLILALAGQMEGGATASNVARVETMRSEGAGFGEIAHEFDISLGQAVSSSMSANANADVTVVRNGKGQIRDRVETVRNRAENITSRIENRVENLRNRVDNRVDALRDRLQDLEFRGELRHHHESALDAGLGLR